MSILFKNGKFYTMDTSKPGCANLTVTGDRITDVSDTAVASQHTKTYDLQGRTVIPGLIDAHTHFTGWALQSKLVNLRDLTDLEQVLSTIRQYMDKCQPDDWIVGGRFDKNIWRGGIRPHRKYLDPISGSHPIALFSKDGHSVWVNSLVLQKIGFTRETPDPVGGEIERDSATGELTGVLKENALRPVWEAIPPPTDAQRREGVLDGIRTAHGCGLTGVHCMELPADFRMYLQLQLENSLKLRICHMIQDSFLDAAIALSLRTGFGNEWLRIGQVKIFSDGALGSQTAEMLEPYENATSCGIGTYTQEELTTMIGKAAQNGLAVAVHAIGDRANRKVLNAIEQTQQAGLGLNLRHRIEHAQLLHPDDQPRFARLGVIASMQPIHCAADVQITERHLGRRANEAYVFRNLLKSGARLAFSSDAPIETIDPFQGIYAAVERKYQNDPGAPSWYADQTLTVQEAVYAYTMGAAYASNEEHLKGSLSPGKLADFVVLDRDIFTIPHDEILSTRVMAVVLGGETVYGEL